MRKQLLLLFIICFSAIKSFAADPKVLFEQANKTYRSGDYAKATELYEQILKDGHRSPALYFNLGNAYYKQENYAKAILNYERARKMNPQDDDILFNLKMANVNTVDKIEPVPQLFYEQWWENFVNTFDADRWSQWAVALLWIALVFAVLYLFASSIAMRKTWFMCAAFGFLGFILLLYVSYSANKQLNSNHAAIIMNPSAYVKSSPDDKSTNLFMLHAGTRIEILDQLQNWKKIKIANGNVGWISKEDVEII
jgi:tetratricopeptide (TPR) repeat protein